MGVIGCIITLTYPVLMFCWKMCPALAAGNTVVIKPSEYTSLTSLYCASLIREAGFPAGVVNVVTGLGQVTGKALALHNVTISFFVFFLSFFFKVFLAKFLGRQ